MTPDRTSEEIVNSATGAEVSPKIHIVREPKSVWFLFQGMAWGFILYYLADFILGGPIYTSIYRCFHYEFLIISLTLILHPLFLIACVCAVFQTRRSPDFVRVTAFWMFAFLFASFPRLLHSAYSMIFGLPPEQFTLTITPQILFDESGRMIMVLVFFIVGNLVQRRQILQPGDYLSRENRYSYLVGQLFFGSGVIIFLYVFFTQNPFNPFFYFPSTRIGMILILIGHFLLRRYFLCLAPIVLAASLVLVHFPGYPLGVVLEAWIPTVLFGLLVCILCRAVPLHFRLVGFLVPVIFLLFLVSILHSYEKMTRSVIRVRDPGMQTVKPKDFPAYLSAPAGAYDLGYRKSDAGSSGSHFKISYKINESYPARNTLAFIERSLTSAGLHPLFYAKFKENGAISKTPAWNEYRDTGKTPVLLIRELIGRWSDGRNRFVFFDLRYAGVFKDPKPSTVLQVEMTESPK